MMDLRVWDCRTPAQALDAAFEAHEVALRAGLMPDEAISLSLTIAELTSRGAVAEVSMSCGPTHWRLEAQGVRQAPVFATVSRDVRPQLSQSGTHAVAEYVRR